MKKATKLILLPLVLALGFTSYAQAYQNCDAKRKALEYQLSKAQSYGNYHRVIGLKRALAKVNMYCKSGSYHNDYIAGDYMDEDFDDYIGGKYAGYSETKLRKKLLDKQKKMIDIEYDIKKARAKGKLDKVAKLQRKYAEKKAEASAIQSALDSVAK